MGYGKSQGYLVLLFSLLLFQSELAAQTGHDKYSSLVDTITPNLLVVKKRISFLDTLYLSDTILVAKDVIIVQKDSIVKNIILKIGRSHIDGAIIDSIISKIDTIVLKQDTIFSPSEKILLKIHDFSKRKNFFSKFLRNFFRYEPPRQLDKPVRLVKSDRPYMQYEDKIIRKVEIVVLDPFGYDIKDLDRKPKSLLEKAGNLSHIKTYQRIIKNRLLFEKGDKVDPFKLAESERLLRQSGYIYDARFIINENQSGDSLDIKVVAQDIFSISAGVKGDLKKKVSEIALQDVNFLGLGQTLQYRIFVSPEIPGLANHYTNYYINNIHNTFLSSNIYFNSENGRKSYGGGINRYFVTPSLKWIGGINMERFKFPARPNLPPRFMGDSLIFNRYDSWAGIPTTLFISDRSKKEGKRVIFTGRYVQMDLDKRPVMVDRDSYPFYNTKFILGSISVFNRRTYKDKFIFRFGRTEDIPEGSIFSVISGMHYSERADRPYNGLLYSISRYKNRVGYYFFNFGAGGFLNDKRIEEGVVHTKALYITPLISTFGWSTRHFFGVRFSHGENMISGVRTNINNEAGLRGFNSAILTGNEKLILNYESNFFLPYNIVGFRLAFVLFADFAWVGYQEKLLNKSNFYPGIGTGIKIKNDHLIFDAIQILFGYYPYGQYVGARNYLFFQRNNSFFTFNDFNYSQPDMIPF